MAKKKQKARDAAPTRPAEGKKERPFNPAMGEALGVWKRAQKVSEPVAPPAPKRRRAAPAPTAASRPVAEGDLFQAAMSGVRPINDRERERRVAARPAAAVGTDYIDDDSDVMAQLHALVDGEVPFRIQDSDDYLVGFVEGFDQAMLKELKAGQVSWTLHLDLHGLTREEAKPRLVRFLIEARRNGHRCVLVVTGRGLGSPERVSVLRQSLPAWVSHGPAGKIVLCFCTALPRDGGPGAFYLLLRKSGVKPFIPLTREDEDGGQGPAHQ